MASFAAQTHLSSATVATATDGIKLTSASDFTASEAHLIIAISNPKSASYRAAWYEAMVDSGDPLTDRKLRIQSDHAFSTPGYYESLQAMWIEAPATDVKFRNNTGAYSINVLNESLIMINVDEWVSGTDYVQESTFHSLAALTTGYLEYERVTFTPSAIGEEWLIVATAAHVPGSNVSNYMRLDDEDDVAVWYQDLRKGTNSSFYSQDPVMTGVYLFTATDLTEQNFKLMMKTSSGASLDTTVMLAVRLDSLGKNRTIKTGGYAPDIHTAEAGVATIKMDNPTGDVLLLGWGMNPTSSGFTSWFSTDSNTTTLPTARSKNGNQNFDNGYNGCNLAAYVDPSGSDGPDYQMWGYGNGSATVRDNFFMGIEIGSTTEAWGGGSPPGTGVAFLAKQDAQDGVDVVAGGTETVTDTFVWTAGTDFDAGKRHLVFETFNAWGDGQSFHSFDIQVDGGNPMGVFPGLQQTEKSATSPTLSYSQPHGMAYVCTPYSDIKMVVTTPSTQTSTLRNWSRVMINIDDMTASDFATASVDWADATGTGAWEELETISFTPDEIGEKWLIIGSAHFTQLGWQQTQFDIDGPTGSSIFAYANQKPWMHNSSNYGDQIATRIGLYTSVGLDEVSFSFQGKALQSAATLGWQEAQMIAVRVDALSNNSATDESDSVALTSTVDTEVAAATLPRTPTNAVFLLGYMDRGGSAGSNSNGAPVWMSDDSNVTILPSVWDDNLDTGLERINSRGHNYGGLYVPIQVHTAVETPDSTTYQMYTIVNQTSQLMRDVRFLAAELAVPSSGYSSPWVQAAASTDPAPLDPPTAPLNLALTVLSSASIQLDWDDTSDNETGFQVEISTNGVTGWTVRNSPAADAITFTDTGLTAESLYYYRVRAYNGDGYSAYTTVESATTEPTVPGGGTDALSDADSYWLANTYSGTGDLIDLGSTHDMTITGPLFRDHSENYVYFPGTNTDYLYATVPAVTAADIDSVTLYLRCSLSDLTPVADSSLFRLVSTAAATEIIQWTHETGGGFEFIINDTTTGNIASTTTATLASETLAVDTVYWFKAVIADIQTTTVTGDFYWHADQATQPTTAWNQVGAQVSATTDGTLSANIAGVVVGLPEGTTTAPWSVYAATAEYLDDVTTIEFASISGTDISPDRQGLDFPGASGDFAVIPSMDLPDDHELEIALSMTDWTPAATSVLLRKGDTSNYGLQITTTGQIAYRVATTDYPTTATISAEADTILWIKTFYDVSAGTVDVYTATDGATYTLFEQLTSLPTSLTTNDVALTVGADEDGTGSRFTGVLHYLRIDTLYEQDFRI